ncbi:MAG: HU family DNA-binding protein [Bacteroidales bacterium]|jgi:DNA-binding protein HU-beta
MNKADLIAAMAAESGLSKVDAKKALDAFLTATTEALKNGERVTLVGFGSFVVGERGARMGRNPRTGDTIKIKAKKVVKFRPSIEL